MDAFLTSQLKIGKKIVIPEKWHFLPQKNLMWEFHNIIKFCMVYMQVEEADSSSTF